MNFYHVISTIDVSSGGPARSVTHLIEAIHNTKSDIEIELSTLECKNPIATHFSNNRGKINLLSYGKLGYSKELIVELEKTKAKLFHGHGLWELPVHYMAKIARKKGVPYIITPRGMLETWSLTQAKFKKKLALKLFQYKDLAGASCLHATAPMEVESIRKLGFKNPIAMIPNGVNVDDFPEVEPQKEMHPKKILFLSRIHIKKGIENLIEAWKLINDDDRKNWKIEIVGNGDEAYIQSLKEKIISDDLTTQIEIKKPVFGEEKIKLFREASLFVLPTFSENFGIVIAEALASYTPVITTKGAPWQDLETHNCGWWINLGVTPLKLALEDAISKSSDELLILGRNGRELIKNNYSMESVAKQMLDLYDWVLTKKNKPKFIDIV
ncbi:glycosyltransferase [Polaribacter sargassicola]|uniref:glycosyltransferase n=1 Tax=Polaribacter sargassicola TaxID=2836891 RepID=UPI001F24FE2F|nr:glycosyltransferase [Polaribacter sp. DS7-9]MCG1036554.1 glycosyltransferase [Polaribacter sp. DS7-9]